MVDLSYANRTKTVWKLLTQILTRKPKLRCHNLGTLDVPSRCLRLADSMYIETPVLIPELAADRCEVNADVIVYPSGDRRIAKVVFDFAAINDQPLSKIGEVPVDGAKVVALDNDLYERAWTQEGTERVGVISTPRHLDLAKHIYDRFRLESVPVNICRSELTEPVSPELEQEILDHIRTLPEFTAKWTGMYFRVETKNTFEKIQDAMSDADYFCCRVELDSEAGGTLVAVTSGYGDGCYPVYAATGTDGTRRLEIPFIDPASESIGEPTNTE